MDRYTVIKLIRNRDFRDPSALVFVSQNIVSHHFALSLSLFRIWFVFELSRTINEPRTSHVLVSWTFGYYVGLFNINV